MTTGAWSDEFTYDYLERLLEATRKRFELRLLRDGPGTDTDPPRAILRHDVDVSPRRAVCLAEHESDWGVAATYLVQVDCPLYRLDDSEGRSGLARLAQLGHEVGLHVDVNAAAEDPAAIETRVDVARGQLEELTGGPVRSVSFHRPLPGLLRGPTHVAGLVNAYGGELMTAYLSDSEGRWRQGEPIGQIRAVEGRFLQLLVHPIWWAEGHLSPADRLEEFFVTETRDMAPGEVETFDYELFRAVEPPERRGRLVAASDS